MFEVNKDRGGKLCQGYGESQVYKAHSSSYSAFFSLSLGTAVFLTITE